MNPYNVLEDAVSKVPAMKYALAVAALAAVVAIGLGFKLRPEVAVFGALIVIALMFVLAVFSRYAGEEDKRALGPANVLVWFYTIAVMVVTTLFITSYFGQWPISFAGHTIGPPLKVETTPPLVPVTIGAVRRGSLAPESRTLFTVLDPSSHVIRQELVPDIKGQANIELATGKYELEAVGAEKPLSFEVSPPQTIITVQVGSEKGPPHPTILSESFGVATGFSHGAFNDDILVSVVSDDMTGNPATCKITFTAGVRNGVTRTYKLQDVGSLARVGRFKIRLTDVLDWGAKFQVEDKRGSNTEVPAVRAD